MKHIRNAVIQSIYRHAENDEALIRELEELVEDTSDERVYSMLFKVLTHLDLAPGDAAECWAGIINHRKEVNRKLGRDVNLRTAICDYFCSIDKTLKNPVVVEIHIFEDHLNSMKYDSLTRLYTRTTFDETLQRELSRAKRYETDLSVLFLDLDDFKRVNDTFGHIAGDMVLKEVAGTVSGQIRTEDLAARYGGEEIVIILPRTGKVSGLILAERIREKVESIDLRYDEFTIQPTVSGGLATYPIDAQNATDLLKCADSALYRAKDFGKNNITVYSHDKRRYLRVNFAGNMQIKQLGHAPDFASLKVKSKNISLAGVLFQSDVLIDIGTRLELRIPLEGTDTPMSVIGTVVRVEIFEKEHYDIGVSFLELERSAKNEISRYIIRQLELGS